MQLRSKHSGYGWFAIREQQSVPIGRHRFHVQNLQRMIAFQEIKPLLQYYDIGAYYRSFDDALPAGQVDEHDYFEEFERSPLE